MNPNEVMQFLWQHIRCDVDTIHTAVGCSLDDVLVLVHLLLKHALEAGGLGGLYSSLYSFMYFLPTTSTVAAPAAAAAAVVFCLTGKFS